ncbi:MAG: allophanate hydrolase [Pseudomonadota bacterium]
MGWTISQWRAAYLQDQADPAELLGELLAGLQHDDPAWIMIVDSATLKQQLGALSAALEKMNGKRSHLPLYGIPFAIKDNMDVAGLPTTAACPAFAHVAEHDATVVARLRAAGAILLGKTNLDQFATGLVGVRSPYGVVTNPFNPAYIGGGSSSGSASVVARGNVPFALGTDTAGSGRVPAAFNNLVGLKPTRGLVSNTGVLPACRTLDCVSVFALNVEDAGSVLDVIGGFDAVDPYSRHSVPDQVAVRMDKTPRFAIPQQPDFCGDEVQAAAYMAALVQMRELGVTLEPIDFSPMQALAALLYEGPWVAERYAAIAEFITDHAADMHPVVRDIIERAARYNAVDTFKAEYRRAELKRALDMVLADFDALLVPSTPTLPTLATVEAEPIAVNSQLGIYTNFVNLGDCAALALPAGWRSDGLPFGVTLIAPAWRDRALLDFAQRWQCHAPWTLGATGRESPADRTVSAEPVALAPGYVRLAVVGAHLTGMPLNHQLTTRHAQFVERTQTASCYRLYALPNTTPPKPGLVRDAQNGSAVEVEVWDVPTGGFGAFVAEVPAPLGIGSLELQDGSMIKGFICESWALRGATEITALGGWRAYLAQLNN